MRGGLVHVFDGDVPAGTYDEIKVVVAPVRNTDAGVSAGIAAMNRASVIIDGTIAEAITDGGPTDGGPTDGGTTDGGTTDGGTSATPFSFASSLRAAQKHEMEITVNSTTHNLTLTIDPSGWFKAADGGRLDRRCRRTSLPSRPTSGHPSRGSKTRTKATKSTPGTDLLPENWTAVHETPV